jgi:predicted GIY-YIG superfamily endonuclease
LRALENSGACIIWRRAWKLALIEEQRPTWRDRLEDYLS